MVGLSFSGKEVAHGVSDLPFDTSAAVLLLLGLGLILDRQRRFLMLSEELIARWPFCETFAQRPNNFSSPVVGFNDLVLDVFPDVVLT